MCGDQGWVLFRYEKVLELDTICLCRVDRSLLFEWHFVAGQEGERERGRFGRV